MGIEEVANKATKMISEKPIKCPSHNDPLKVYCIECDQPMCYLCTIKDHKGHDHTLVDDAYKECKQKIKEKLKLLEENVEQSKERTKEMEESKKNVQEKATKGHKQNINQLCDDFVEKIQKIRHLGLQAVEGGMASYIACKDQQIEKEEAAIQALYDCKEHVECSLEKSSSIQLLLMKQQIMERFEEIVVPSKTLKPNIADENSSDDEEEKPLWRPFIQHSKPPKVPKNASNDLTIINLMSSIFSFALLEYPELVREQCEVVADFPKEITTSSSCTGTFALLFKGHSMFVDTTYVSSLLEPSTGRLSLLDLESQCFVDRADDADDDMKYRVSFIPQNYAGTYFFRVKVGSTLVSTKIEVQVVKRTLFQKLF